MQSMKIWGCSLDKKMIKSLIKNKSRCVFGLRQWGGPKQTWSDPTSENLFFFFSFFNFAALLKVKPTSNCSSLSVQETDGFKADQVPPVWWVNFNHQSWAGGVHYVHEVICILIPFIHLCGYFFLSLQIYSLLVHRVSKNSDEGSWCLHELLM